MGVKIFVGDMRQRLRELPDNSVDSCVCDPPYHLTSIVKRWSAGNAAPPKVEQTGVYRRVTKGFMGQTWDGGDVAFDPETWAEVLRVLKPGGHLLAFSGTRTYHRMAVAIEDAGFEVRDMIAWHYGSGFPKSHDVAKAITAQELHGGSNPQAIRKARQGSDYAPTGQEDYRKGRAFSAEIEHDRRPTDLTDAAREWQGYGTALKPATEPICLARKPISESSIAANVLKWGTGALNIDGCRIATTDADARDVGRQINRNVRNNEDGWGMNREGAEVVQSVVPPEGRWPANLVHDGSDEVVAGFPETASGVPTAGDRNGGVYGEFAARSLTNHGPSEGSAARFFYCAKATTEERGEGNNHPTVKPVALMRWLVRLVTPKGGTVLDPFAGSGTTGIAAMQVQVDAILVEQSPEYAEIARKRLSGDLFSSVSVAA